MATPHNALYKKAQRAARNSKRRAKVLWVSCTQEDLFADKVPDQGTYTRPPRIGITGKAAIKRHRRSTHTKGHYREQRA